MTDNKPCPFCGSRRLCEDEEWRSGDEGEFVVKIVESLDCMAVAPATIWNERQTPAQAWQQQLADQCEAEEALHL